MADVGSLLLPDIDLMGRYEQSFQRQQALKNYVYQDTEKKKAEFAKENYFDLDSGLALVEGQQQAMIKDMAEYQKDYQTALQDHSRGGMWGLDPATQAKFAARRFKLQAEQNQRLGAIKKVSSALAVMQKPGFSSSYNTKWTQDYINDIKSGKIRDDDPLKPLPKNPMLVIDDLFKGEKPTTIYSDPMMDKSGRIIRQNKTEYLPSIAGDKFNGKTYKQQGYEWLHNKLTSNPASAQVLGEYFDNYAEQNPEQAKQLIAEHGNGAPYALLIAQYGKEIEAKMMGVPVAEKPKYEKPEKVSEAKLAKIIEPSFNEWDKENPNAMAHDISEKNVYVEISQPNDDDPKQQEVKHVKVVAIDEAGHRAWGEFKSGGGGDRVVTEVKPIPYSKAKAQADAKGLILKGNTQQSGLKKIKGLSNG